MKASIIIQAVVLMLILALAASCSVGKEYTTRVFGKPKNVPADSSAVAVKFLEMEGLNDNKDMIVVNLPAEMEKTERTDSIPLKRDVVRTKKTRD